jgi:hypothetical protein
MRKPGPTRQELQGMAGDFKAKFANAFKYVDDKWVAPYEMWGKMLDLIYSGNMDAAWKLCDLSWPANHPGKQRFLNDFKKRLATSSYFATINQLNLANRAVHKN